MALFGRPDGDRVQNLSMLRRFIPHLMPGRNESAVFFNQTLDLSHTLSWLEAANAELGQDDKISFFHVVIAAMARTLGQRPQLNRYISGRRVYQRRDIAISFAVKKSFEDEAPLTTVKITFGPDDTLLDVGRRLREAIGQGRGQALTTSEKELKVVAAMPRGVMRAVMGAQRWLDYWNLLPGAMIQADPMYASVFVANLGSIGLDAPFHHLYEYGTIPIFVVIGRIKKAPVVDEAGQIVAREVVDLKYTLDERVADGFYCARSLELLRGLVERPEALMAPPEPTGR